MIREKIRIPLLCFLLVFCYVFGFVYFSLEASAAELSEAADLQEDINAESLTAVKDLKSLNSSAVLLSDTALTFGQFGFQAISGAGVISFNRDYKVVYCFVPSGVRVVATGSNNPMWYHSGALIQPGDSEPLVSISLPYVTTEAGYIYSVKPYSDSMSLNIEIDSSYVPPSDPPGGGDSGGGSGDINVDLTNVEALLTDIQKDVNDNMYEVRTLLAICAALLVLTVFLCRRSK